MQTNEWNSLSDQGRKIPKCKPCMAVRRATKERGFGPIYCLDCEETLKTAKVKVVRDDLGKPLFIETEYPGVETLRPCRKCSKMTSRYRFCNDCLKLESEMDDFIHMTTE